MQHPSDTIDDLMQQCAHQLPSRFGVDDVLTWFEHHHPGTPASTVRTRLARRTEGSASRPRHDGAPALFRRVRRGVYELAPPNALTGRTTTVTGEAAVLFAVYSPSSPDEAHRRTRARLFAESKREAGRNGERWFGLSSHYGLIHDVDSSPADILMGEVPPAHGDTWAAWVSIRLEAAMRSLRGKRVRIDAPEQYSLLLGPALEAHGAVVEIPDRGTSRTRG